MSLEAQKGPNAGPTGPRPFFFDARTTQTLSEFYESVSCGLFTHASLAALRSTNGHSLAFRSENQFA
jgi:hypothetical protein